MKTRFLLPALLALLICTRLNAQYCGNSGPLVCSPTGQLSQPGFSPSYFQLSPIVNGVPTSLTLQFQNYDTLTALGSLQTVDSLQIDTIANLPTGMCWSTNKTNNTYNTNENGCILLSGTPCSTPGQYQMYIVANLWLHSFGGQALTINCQAIGLYYYLRVNNAGEATIAMDTAGAPTFIAYGPTANCQIGPPSVSLGPNQTVCNGSALILNPIITGGLPPFTFSWQSSGSALSCNNCANPAVTINQNSTYIMALTDANGNVAVDTITYTISGTNNALQLGVSNTDLSCTQSTDTTTLSITNGHYPFSLNWGDGSTQSDSTTVSAMHNYTLAGVYVISVKDSSGCSSSIFDTVLNTGVVAALNQAVQPNCFNSGNGSISVTASGGTPPYTYAWSNSDTGIAITGLSEGYYSVTVTDITSCSATFTYYLNSLSDPWGYYIFMNETDANCSNNGTLNPSVYGGIPPYTYLWSNGAVTNNISGLSAGIYTVTVSDSAGCQVSGGTQVNTSCFSYINGIIFYDHNGNCTYSIGDTGVSGLSVVAYNSSGGWFYGSSDANGNYSIAVNDTGTYTLYADNNYFFGACGNITFCGNNNQTVFVPVLSDTLPNNNIGVSGATGFDLGIHPGWTSADPGFTKQYWVFYYNSSSIPFTGPATITFIYDSNLVYQYSDETPAPVNNVAAHTLTWNLDSVTGSYISYSERLDAYFQVPASLSLNYLLQSDFTITPMTGDCDTSDNHYHYAEIVTGCHDPNEKDVVPAGPITESDSMLTYTIHFQNTGTDSTHFVVVKDTLSPNLDPATARTVASSDVYSSFAVSGKGILTWTFNPLRIVDSLTNAMGSKRFVMFTVKKRSNLPIGATISNSASVYFDYNTPVVTNTVADTITVSGISELSSSNNISVKAYPNPFSDATNIVVSGLNEKFGFELYDVTGRLQIDLPSLTNNQFQVQRGGLASGIYLYRIVAGNRQVACGKLVVE